MSIPFIATKCYRNTYKEAVVTGCSSRYEDNITWWLDCLRKSNSDLPIIFYDFGLSEAVRSELRKTDNLLFISDVFDGEEFKWSFKQRACIDSSRYAEKIIWLDQDCEVFDSLYPVFAKCQNFTDFVISRDAPVLIYPGDKTTYFNQRQAGVFCCYSKNPILQRWIDIQDHHLNDQVAISYLLDNKVLGVRDVILDIKYHWPRVFVKSYLDMNYDSPTIIHWTGKIGLQIIESRKIEAYRESIKDD